MSGQRAAAQQLPELLLDAPGGADLVGRVIDAQRRLEPGQARGLRVFPAPQQPAVGPGRGAGRGQGSFGSPNAAVLGARELQLESGGQVVGAEGLAGVQDCLGGDAPVDLGGPDAAVEGHGQ
jgi:hypothetical protein